MANICRQLAPKWATIGPKWPTLESVFVCKFSCLYVFLDSPNLPDRFGDPSFYQLWWQNGPRMGQKWLKMGPNWRHPDGCPTKRGGPRGVFRFRLNAVGDVQERKNHVTREGRSRCQWELGENWTRMVLTKIF